MVYNTSQHVNHILLTVVYCVNQNNLQDITYMMLSVEYVCTAWLFFKTRLRSNVCCRDMCSNAVSCTCVCRC